MNSEDAPTVNQQQFLILFSILRNANGFWGMLTLPLINWLFQFQHKHK